MMRLIVRAMLAASVASTASAQTLEELRNLSIDELVHVEITSVSKRPEPLSRAPAAVYVITAEEIRRSGYRTLPEVLRLAPNLHVARVQSHSYSISARGFNDPAASNKLLVLIDGRSIYSPLHAGVFYDQQQVMVEDIERIEVISGPGGVLWGANAVNGVINVLTKSARDTQGGLATTQLGIRDQHGAVRYGGKLGETGGWRVYGLGSEIGNTVRPTGRNGKDDHHTRQAGFRIDWGDKRDSFIISGDVWNSNYHSGIAGQQDYHLDNRGGNLLGRWTHTFEDKSSFELQTYYDRATRRVPNASDDVETFDVEAQHSFTVGESHQIVWGGGYRHNKDHYDTTRSGTLNPARGKIEIANLFAQDTIRLSPDWSLTLGLKAEHNSLSGLEWMPAARLGWAVDDSNFLWAAVSRVVRTPSRIDHDLVQPGFFEQPFLNSEKLIAYELGWRGRPLANLSVSANLYWHDYQDLRVFAPGETVFVTLRNAMHGHIYGLETWGDWQVLDWWRLSAGINLMEKNLRVDPGALGDLAIEQNAGNDPQAQLHLRSAMNLGANWELDVGLRYVAALPEPSVSDYLAVDARLGWNVSDALQLSIAGFGLFDSHHAEAGVPQSRREIPTGLYAGLRWKF